MTKKKYGFIVEVKGGRDAVSSVFHTINNMKGEIYPNIVDDGDTICVEAYISDDGANELNKTIRSLPQVSATTFGWLRSTTNHAI